MKIISFIFVLVLMLSACSGGSALQQNREKWEGQNFDHYRFTVALSCFCAFAGAEVTYDVQNGQVVNESVQAAPDRPVDAAQVSEIYQAYNTIEKVFDYVEQATNEADATTVEYDPTYGFPTEIAVDQLQQAADDELYLTLSNFEPLP
jgi:ABC-type glycerol-3-phosphate transport system substrate-binding protein